MRMTKEREARIRYEERSFAVQELLAELDRVRAELQNEKSFNMLADKTIDQLRAKLDVAVKRADNMREGLLKIYWEPDRLGPQVMHEIEIEIEYGIEAWDIANEFLKQDEALAKVRGEK